MEPVVAAPRMPQQSGPRNATQEEAAALPSPVATPSFAIPPHLMGRNIDNPAADMIGSGRKLQKPRLGVRVPYRNLTSQIVTQNEIAQEILERSLKKHPVHDTPEGGDLFFAMKLTQRLANRLSPSIAPVSNSLPSQVEANPAKSSEFHNHKNATSLTSVYTYVADGSPIADQKSIYDIESSEEGRWVLDGKQLPHMEASCSSNMSSVVIQTLPVKLDPIVERELALKQLMELPIRSKKKADTSVRKPQRKPKPNKDQNSDYNEVQSGKSSHRVLSSENNNAEIITVKQDSKVISRQPPVRRVAVRKRKLPEDICGLDSKMRRCSRASKLSHETNAVDPTESQISKNQQPKVGQMAKVSITRISNVSNLVPAGQTSHSSKVAYSGKKEVGSDNLDDRNPATNADVGAAAPQTSASVDNVPKTYSSRKRHAKTTVGIAVSSLKSKKETSSNVVLERSTRSLPVTLTNTDTSIRGSRLSGRVPTKKAQVKRCREIDRLLMDEGAINILYEMEQGDSKRRSSGSSGTAQRQVKLRSTRRKKKDLLLRTRLVKNAVLRLSNSPTTTSISLRPKKELSHSHSSSLSLQDQSHVGPPRLVPQTPVDPNECPISPPLLTPVDAPSSPMYPATPGFPAECSRIYRRHSSSSTFSSRSTSPNVVLRSSLNPEYVTGQERKSVEVHATVESTCEPAAGAVSGVTSTGSKQLGEVRRKGVPIYVRKQEAVQTYKGKKKRNSKPASLAGQSTVVATHLVISQSDESLITLQTQEAPDSLKTEDVRPATPVLSSKKSKVIVAQGSRKASGASKPQVLKTVQAGLQKRPAASPTGCSSKKKACPIIKRKGALKSKTQEIQSKAVAMPALTKCLAEAATAFAAESKGSKKVNPSNTSGSVTAPPVSSLPSKCAARNSLPAPLSPNAASYSVLIKSLETESQKQQRKKDEEAAKQRSSVRQNVGSNNYKEICLRRYDNLVQIILTPASTKIKNSMNLQVLRELRDALIHLKRDESCRVVLVTSTGSVFCQGIDFYALLQTNADRRKCAALELAQALKEFLKALAMFTKPIVAGVHGAAIGLGVTMLPFFDMVFASDKATFYTPYAKLGQVPEGAATLTLPHMLGNTVTSELLFGCRTLTANEALHFGLVTRVLWPGKFLEELIPILRSMASQSAQSMEATKALLRHNLRTKLDAALEAEGNLLVQHWSSNECQEKFRNFIEEEVMCFQR